MNITCRALSVVLAVCSGASFGCSGEIDSVIPPRDGGVTNKDSGDSQSDAAGPLGDMARPWSDVSVGGVTGNFWSVWNSGTGVVMAAGDGAMIYKSVNGAAFAAETSTKPVPKPNLLSIGAALPWTAGKPLFTVGQQGTVWSYAGDLASSAGTFTAETTGVTKGLYGLWVGTDGTVWSVGEGVAIKRTGTTWSTLTGIDATSAAYNLWGTATSSGVSLYAVGSSGKIWHSTGGNFVAETSGTSSALYGVWGSGPNDIYAVGDVGTILHSTGNGTWTQQNSGVTVPLEGISGVNANEIYIVGDMSTLLHKNEAASVVWDAEALPATASGRAVNGAFATSSAVYVVGNAGLILKK